MKNILTRPVLFTAIAAIAAVAIGLVAWTAFVGNPWQYRKSGEVYTSHGYPVIDATDDRQLVGFTDKIFIGLVLSNEGQTEKYGWPENQFSVKVLEVLKGSVQQDDVLTVNQQGGTGRNGDILRMEGDPHLLTPGDSYLFATRSAEPVAPWNTLVPGYGNIKIAVSKDADAIHGLDAQKVEELRSRFRAAIQDETPFDPSVPYIGGNAH